MLLQESLRSLRSCSFSNEEVPGEELAVYIELEYTSEVQTHLWPRHCDYTNCQMGKFDKDDSLDHLFQQLACQCLKVWNLISVYTSGPEAHK